MNITYLPNSRVMPTQRADTSAKADTLCSRGDGFHDSSPHRWPVRGTILLVFVTGSLSIWGYVGLVRWAFT